MNKRSWGCVIVAIGAFACLLCGALALGLGLWSLSPESVAQFSIAFEGGTRISLEADIPQGIPVPPDQMQVAVAIIRSRLGRLGYDSIVRIQGERHLTVDIAGAFTSTQAIKTAFGTGLLEFVDVGSTPIPEGTEIQTTGPSMDVVPDLDTPNGSPGMPRVYRTVMTGKDLKSASISFSSSQNRPLIAFTLTEKGARILAEHTSKNVGKYLVISLDRRVISSPVIKNPIADGSGVIEGDFTLDQARNFVTQLSYGALPFPLRFVGVTSIEK